MRFRMDPRAKLYLLLLANLMLFFHVGTGAEAVATGLFLLLFFLSGHTRTGIRLSVVYFGLLAIDLFVVPLAGEGILLNLLSLVSVGIRMMLPCIITGAYAFSTTTVGELTSALRRMHVPESVIIPCAVVVRFFPTVQEDYHQIHNAQNCFIFPYFLQDIGKFLFQLFPVKRRQLSQPHRQNRVCLYLSQPEPLHQPRSGFIIIPGRTNDFDNLVNVILRNFQAL